MIVGCLIDGIIPSCYLTSVFPILQTAQLALKERLNMPSTLSNATLGVGEAELSSMALAGYGLSEGLEGFQVSKDGYLDNATVAEHSFPGNTTGEISGTGRITGYIREFVTPIPVEDIEPGDNLMAATVWSTYLMMKTRFPSGWLTNFLVNFKERFSKIWAEANSSLRLNQPRSRDLPTKLSACAPCKLLGRASLVPP